MDNKKWYNRFATIFWWSLAILPLIIVLIHFIGYHLTFNSGITSASELANYHSDINGNFVTIWNTYLTYTFANTNMFGFFTINSLVLTFKSLFNSFGVTNSQSLAIFFGWMTSVAFYHLCFDFFVWLPRFFHSLLDKGVGKID